MDNQSIAHCIDGIYCFKSRRSKTGYACEVWGYDDFACDTKLDGFCHKAKKSNTASLNNQKGVNYERKN